MSGRCRHKTYAADKWCMRCSGKMRKTLEEMQALAHSRGGVCLSRTYKNMGTKLTMALRMRTSMEGTTAPHWPGTVVPTMRE